MLKNKIKIMKMTNEFQLIRDWADAKGIFAKGDVKTFSDLIEAHKSRLGRDYIKLKELVTRGDLSKIASMLSNELKSVMGDSEPDHGPVG